MVATRMSETPNASREPEEIAVVVKSLYDAWQQRDEALIRSHFSQRPDLKIWGTGHVERLVGRQSIDREFAGWIATCPPWVSIMPTHRSMDVRDELAWVADDIEARWSSSGDAGVNHYRITTIWQVEDGEWRLVHSNFASPS